MESTGSRNYQRFNPRNAAIPITEKMYSGLKYIATDKSKRNPGNGKKDWLLQNNSNKRP